MSERKGEKEREIQTLFANTPEHGGPVWCVPETRECVRKCMKPARDLLEDVNEERSI